MPVSHRLGGSPCCEGPDNSPSSWSVLGPPTFGNSHTLAPPKPPKLLDKLRLKSELAPPEFQTEGEYRGGPDKA